MFAIDRCARADNNGQKDIKRREPKGYQGYQAKRAKRISRISSEESQKDIKDIKRREPKGYHAKRAKRISSEESPEIRLIVTIFCALRF